MSEGRRFHLRRRLGQGGHGEVYLAEQESPGGFRRRVALKVLRPGMGQRPEAVRRIRDEARILGRLSHRHIVGVTDLVRLDDRWAVVMDYVEGADLERVTTALRTAGDVLPPRVVGEVGLAVLRALAAAWKTDNGDGAPLRVVHRDLKPSNVVLGADGSVKVLDFGVARVDLVARESATGEVRPGTLRYMAPERLDRGEDGPAGDVYAWGATLFEIIALQPLGRSPGQAEAHASWVDERLALVPGALRGPTAEIAPPGIDVEVIEASQVDTCVQLLRQALAAEPAVRPSAAELADRLASLVAELPGEDLEIFAARFLPRVAELVAQEESVVSGTLSEHSTPAASRTPVTWLDAEVGEGTTAIGLASGAATPSAPASEPKTAARPTWWRWGAVILGVALLLLCAGLLPLAFEAGPETSTAPDEDRSSGLASPIPAPSPPKPTEPPEEAPTASIVALEPTPEPPAGPEPSSPTPAQAARTAAPAPARRPEVTAGAVPAAPPRQSVTPTAEPIEAALFVFPEASEMNVSCGGVSGQGTASVRLRDLPAGSCRVEVVFLGESLETTVPVTEKSEVRCTADAGRLSCR